MHTLAKQIILLGVGQSLTGLAKSFNIESKVIRPIVDEEKPQLSSKLLALLNRANYKGKN